jgi:ABC-type oligopeptide transport system ATPase subunit
MSELLRVENLTKYFPVEKGVLTSRIGQKHAVDDVSFDRLKRERRSALSGSRDAASRRQADA